MKIQWNNVRWYSKLLAMIVFVGTFVLAIWLGMSYTPNNSEKAVDTNVSEETSIPETVIDKEELSTYQKCGGDDFQSHVEESQVRKNIDKLNTNNNQVFLSKNNITYGGETYSAKNGEVAYHYTILENSGKLIISTITEDKKMYSEDRPLCHLFSVKNLYLLNPKEKIFTPIYELTLNDKSWIAGWFSVDKETVLINRKQGNKTFIDVLNPETLKKSIVGEGHSGCSYYGFNNERSFDNRYYVIEGSCYEEGVEALVDLKDKRVIRLGQEIYAFQGETFLKPIGNTTIPIVGYSATGDKYHVSLIELPNGKETEIWSTSIKGTDSEFNYNNVWHFEPGVIDSKYDKSLNQLKITISAVGVHNIVQNIQTNTQQVLHLEIKYYFDTKIVTINKEIVK